jgi:hypothetical protein
MDCSNSIDLLISSVFVMTCLLVVFHQEWCNRRIKKDLEPK